ncbi:hypothetical protein ACFT0G_02925 [Streptomyces sp. NPDC057020]|uniref:hypothetical protein n=1 Tax=unclassified Streptomyces TaxID=2593676 RepID=UPI00362D72F9
MADPEPPAVPAACEAALVPEQWDAVRVPRSVGLIALDILGGRSGAVIEDSDALSWLVPAGAAEGWGTMDVHVVPFGAALSVPAARLTVGPGPYWRICPGDDRLLTPAAALRAALQDASAAAARQPDPCDGSTR